jgi:hypothetical protein
MKCQPHQRSMFFDGAYHVVTAFTGDWGFTRNSLLMLPQIRGNWMKSPLSSGVEHLIRPKVPAFLPLSHVCASVPHLWLLLFFASLRLCV